MAAKEALVFVLADRLYGMGIKHVVGIMQYTDFERETTKGSYYIGKTSMQGDDVLVYDLCSKFHLKASDELTEDARFLVVNLEGRLIAFVVDEVKGMRSFSEDQIQEVPKILEAESTNYLDYVVNADDALVLILRPDNLVEAE